MKGRHRMASMGAVAIVGLLAMVSISLVGANSSATINFENGLAAGDIVGSLDCTTGVDCSPSIGGSIAVVGNNPKPQLAGNNAAMIFDSNCVGAGCSGGDDDLSFPGHGNTLIISKNLDPNDPDDADLVGALFEFDFSGFGPGKIKVNNIDVGDIEVPEGEDGAFLEAFENGCGANSLGITSFPPTGDNVIQTVNVGISGVDCVRVVLNGSGAIDNFSFEVEEVSDPAIDIEKFTKGVPVPVGGDICEDFGKPQVLTMGYTGDGDDATSHSQDSGKVEVTGDPLDASPVRILSTDKSDPNDGKAKVFHDAVVNLGDTFEINSSNAGEDDLKSNTYVHVFGPNPGDAVLQSVKFHTSCSQPLQFGDQFGSVELVGFVDKNGAVATPPAPPAGLGADADGANDADVPEIAPGDAVMWSYKVTNTGDVAFDQADVSVTDDILGGIATIIDMGDGDGTLSPGEMWVYSAMAPAAVLAMGPAHIVPGCGDGRPTYENIGTVNVPGASDEDPSHYCNPPVPPQECDTKVQAMLLRYTGPTINAPTVVEFDPDKGPTVTYNLPSLTNGEVLSDPAQNGFTIDPTVGGEIELGAKTKIRIDGVEEVIHTSCSTPFVSQAPAPLDNPKGDPSPNWFVENFTEKP